MTGVARNPRLLCAFHGLQMTLFPVAVITIFWTIEIGLSMHEIMLLQGLFGLTIAVFEFPSGYLADRLGYRHTLTIGSWLQVIGWGLYWFADDFWTAFAAEAVLGLGLALISGADTALMYESLLETGREDQFRKWDGRFRFFGQTAEGVAALAAGVLYMWSPRLPFLLEVGVSLVNVVVALKLVEPARHVPITGGHVRQAISMVRDVLGRNRRLASVVLLMIGLGLSSFVPVWLIQTYAQDSGISPAWIGPIWAVANFVVAFGSLASDRAAERFGVVPLLFGCVGLVGLGYVGLGLSTAVWGFVFYFAITLMRGLATPTLAHEEQRLLPSTDRAGFLSLRSLMFRLSFLAIGPFVGASVDLNGQRPVLLWLGAGFVALNLVACALFAASRRRAGDGAARG